MNMLPSTPRTSTAEGAIPSPCVCKNSPIER